MRSMCEIDGFTLSDSIAKLIDIEKVTSIKNWNGYNADPISKEVFNKTRDILLRVINQPFIAPTANNSIQLEYHNDDGAYLEFEVFADSVKIFFLHGASYTKPLTNLSDINLMIIDFLYGNYNSIINMEGNKDECN